MTKNVWIVLEKVYVETVCDLDHNCIGWSSDDCDGYIYMIDSDRDMQEIAKNYYSNDDESSQFQSINEVRKFFKFETEPAVLKRKHGGQEVEFEKHYFKETQQIISVYTAEDPAKKYCERNSNNSDFFYKKFSVYE